MDVLNEAQVTAALGQAAHDIGNEIQAAVGRATLLVHRTAVRYSPISPTNAQYSKAVLKRKKRTARRMHPGGLVRSIEWEHAGVTGSVFVAANSEAAKYARKIHDEKGKTWRKRGPGTIAKGSKADDKFIERALRDNQKAIDALMDKAIGKGLKNGK